MTAQEVLNRLDSPDSTPLLATLYGEKAVDAARKRIRALIVATTSAFPETATQLRLFSAPGRTELGGNHTDHNRGKVLAASIQLDALACVSPRPDNTVIFRSTGYSDVVVDLSDLSPRKNEEGKTEALVRGIASEFVKRGTKVRGFTANANSTVLSGSGLSSSAAVEVLFGVIFDGLYGDSKRTAVELAQIGQKAENLYFGKPCGLMDQVACASGGAVAIDFADPAHPLVRNVDFDLTGAGYALCVVDTGGSHADLTPDYSSIPAEMNAVAKMFGKEALREVGRDAFIARLPQIRAATGDRAALRAFHFFAENERVDAMTAALERADKAKKERRAKDRTTAVGDFLNLVAQSGTSSWQLLQNVFTTKRPSEQGVSLALAMTDRFLRPDTSSGSDNGVPQGVCRVHGGGFAGTIQAYIPLARVSEYIEWMKPVFGEKSITVLRIRSIGATELVF
ncbi:MAG: galactokinase family protein [Treponemataceae bacterium]